MNDEEYCQRMRDYENEIYDLNQGVNQSSSNDSSPDAPVKVAPHEDSYDHVSDTSSPPSRKRILRSNSPVARKIHLNRNAPELEGQFSDHSSSLSEDERDMIYSHLFHSSSALPKPANRPAKTETTKESSPHKKTSPNINDQHSVPSTNFTFEIDLDNLPPPPGHIHQATETTSIDEDDDYHLANRGRYFGPPAPPPTQIICFRCGQPGHIKTQCTHQVCHYCNALDSHPTYQCPSRDFCSNCSQTGHSKSRCPIIHNEDPSKPCTMCGGSGHVAAACHQIWRYYRPVEPNKMKICRDIERYCYNCSAAGHLGDDCPRPRPYYVQGGKRGIVVSAFGEGNVPAWVTTTSSKDANSRVNWPRRRGPLGHKQAPKWQAGSY